MSVVVWGLLTKSAEDSTKIEDEIYNYIYAHNADPDAHGLADMALYAHRSGDVLDHLDASVTTEKIKPASITPSKMAMLLFSSCFESLDGYVTEAGVSLDNINGYVQLVTTNVIDNYQQIYKIVSYVPYAWNWDKDRIFETSFYLSSVADVMVWIQTGTINIQRHVGFKIINNSLYGSVGNGTAETTTLLQTISAATEYDIRCVLTAGVKAEFYVDGVLKGTISTGLPSGTLSADIIMGALIYNTAAASKTLRFSYWDVRQAI